MRLVPSSVAMVMPDVGFDVTPTRPTMRALTVMVLVAEFIRASIEEGLTGFDLLKGGLDYKYRFGAQPRRLMRLQLTRET